MHLTGFFVYRIETALFSSALRDHGQDILQKCILFAASRICRFKLRYRNKVGVFVKHHLSTYLWKGTTGIIFSHIKENGHESLAFDAYEQTHSGESSHS
jgi:hypothetical protein